ncbi:MAG: hypothetical protein ABSE80_14855, partial [Halobacteriota archaeon]
MDYRKGKLNYKWAPVDVPKPEKFSGYMPMKKYDAGGDVTATHNGKDVPLPDEDVQVVKKPEFHETEHVPMGKPSSSLPPLPPETKPTPKAPLIYDQGGNVEVKPEEGTDMAARVAYAKGVQEPEAHGEAGRKQWNEFEAHPEGLNTDAPQKYASLARFADTSGPYSVAPKGSALMTPPAWRPSTDSYDEASTIKTPPAAGAPSAKGMKQMELVSTYDQGGDVGMRQLGSEYPVLPTPEGKGNNILENLQNFDQGGDVGAPADFSGPVFPNPKGVRPMLDTEIPPRETERISGGAKMNTDNA